MLTLFSIKDLAAQAFMQPFFGNSKGAVVREFTDMVNSSGADQHPISRHPADYELYLVGFFDEATGTMDYESVQSPVLICRAIDLKISV